MRPDNEGCPLEGLPAGEAVSPIFLKGHLTTQHSINRRSQEHSRNDHFEVTVTSNYTQFFMAFFGVHFFVGLQIIILIKVHGL